jgi:hypothetical protein
MRSTTLPRTLHRPRSAALLQLPRRLGAAIPVRPCLHSRRLVARRRRFLIEGLVAGLATVLLTGVAVAFPAVLRESPVTTAANLAGVILPSLGLSEPSGLMDCP